MASSARPLESQVAVVTSAAVGIGQVYAARLSAMGIGYLHVMETSDAGLKAGVQVEHAAEALRPLFRGLLITKGGLDKTRGQAALDAGHADLVSFGVPFLANPDLVERLRRDASLNPPDPSTMYGQGPRGYTDYPSLAA